MIRTELVRQPLHIAVGGIIFFLLYFALIPTYYIIIFFFLFTLFVFIVHWLKLKWAQQLFHLFERGHELFFGSSPLLFLAGILLALYVFPHVIGLAAVGIFVFGDGIATLVGVLFGTAPLPWNTRKSWQGLFAGMAIALLSALLLVPWYPALIAVIITLVVESIDLRVNDNIVLPLVAGIVLYWLSYLGLF